MLTWKRQPIILRKPVEEDSAQFTLPPPDHVPSVRAVPPPPRIETVPHGAFVAGAYFMAALDAGPRTAQQLATQLGRQPTYIRRVCREMVAEGMIEERWHQPKVGLKQKLYYKKGTAPLIDDLGAVVGDEDDRDRE